MAASGTISIQGTITGLPTGTKTYAGSIPCASAVGEIHDLILASGDNTITVPTGATAVLIQPPATNAVALKLKGDAADVGVKISKTLPTLLSLDQTQATFIVNAASITATATQFSYV